MSHQFRWCASSGTDSIAVMICLLVPCPSVRRCKPRIASAHAVSLLLLAAVPKGVEAAAAGDAAAGDAAAVAGKAAVAGTAEARTAAALAKGDAGISGATARPAANKIPSGTSAHSTLPVVSVQLVLTVKQALPKEQQSRGRLADKATAMNQAGPAAARCQPRDWC